MTLEEVNIRLDEAQQEYDRAGSAYSKSYLVRYMQRLQLERRRIINEGGWQTWWKKSKTRQRRG